MTVPLQVEPMAQPGTLQGRVVFLSASIPDATRWHGPFGDREITDAVTAAGRAVLTASGRLVTGGHPAISPLLLYIAKELPSGADRPRVMIYQSQAFEGALPRATLVFEESGLGELRWTEAAHDREASLRLMRERMLRDTDPIAAIFVGGMQGILDEHKLFTEMYPDRPTYALGRPGGEARTLADAAHGELAAELREGNVYATLFRHVIADLAGR